MGGTPWPGPLDDRFAERGNAAIAGRPELIAGDTTDYAQNGATRFSGTVNWVGFDGGIVSDDQNHLITPEERLQVAMAKQ